MGESLQKQGGNLQDRLDRRGQKKASLQERASRDQPHTNLVIRGDATPLWAYSEVLAFCSMDPEVINAYSKTSCAPSLRGSLCKEALSRMLKLTV